MSKGVYKRTIKNKENISKSKLGNKNGMYGKVPWNKGIKRPEFMGENNPAKRPEVREKIRQSKIGIISPMKGKTHTEETRQKMRENHPDFSLEKHPNWKGGTSFNPYCNNFTESLKREIRNRDNYQCQMPGCLCTQLESKLLYGRVLDIHHIHYNKENIEDLITLCCSCNNKVNFNRNYWEKYFMKILKERDLLNYFVKHG